MERKVKQLTAFGDSTSAAGRKPEEKEDIDYTYDKPFKKLWIPFIKKVITSDHFLFSF